MKYTVIIGNSGSGKSTLAHTLAQPLNIPTLDLDTIAWEPGRIAVPRTDNVANAELDQFCSTQPQWIVEGCYGRLAQRALDWTPELIFVNPGEEVCIRNCRSRPWEPHKYPSKALQDSKLDFLLAWVSDYYRRDDDTSFARHRAIFETYSGRKREIMEL